MTRVLVAEDAPQLPLTPVIHRQAVDAPPDGATALRLATDRGPDAVVLDLGPPDVDGADVTRSPRGGRSRVPILVLSARRGLRGECRRAGRRRRPPVNEPRPARTNCRPGSAPPSAPPRPRGIRWRFLSPAPVAWAA